MKCASVEIASTADRDRNACGDTFYDVIPRYIPSGNAIDIMSSSVRGYRYIVVRKLRWSNIWGGVKNDRVSG